MPLDLKVDWAIKFTDVLIIFATFLGPILAVQAQKWLERRREITNSRMRVFKTLMATRALNLSGAHVEAINAVPLEFYGLRKITTKWKVYFEHLLQSSASYPAWETKRQELLYDLLLEMSILLGYDFDAVEIKKVYAPQGHAVIESDQEAIRQGLAALLKGQVTLPIEIRQINPSNTNASNGTP
jgi:hypothetical protein